MIGMRLLETPDASRRQDHLQEFSDRAVLLDRMSEMNAGIDDVTVSTTVPDTFEYPGFNEMVDQPERAALGDPHSIRDFTQSDVRVFRDADKHVPVVAEECPVTVCHELSPCMKPVENHMLSITRNL